MDWTPDGKQLPHDFLGDLQPEDVLVDYEGPRSFTARDRLGDLLFAHQCGESEEVWRYAVVPFTETLLKELTQGRLDLWSALSQTRLWLADICQDGAVTACVSSSLRQVPETCRPQPGVMIYPEHDPWIRRASFFKRMTHGTRWPTCCNGDSARLPNVIRVENRLLATSRRKRPPSRRYTLSPRLQEAM